jgi:hypothetical protein
MVTATAVKKKANYDMHYNRFAHYKLTKSINLWSKNKYLCKILQFMSANDFILNHILILRKRRIQWSAPSNIALVKYWGKKTTKSNPSVSFTLNNCKTITKLAFAKRSFDFAQHWFRLFSFDLLLPTQRRFQTEDSKIFRKNWSLFHFKRVSFYNWYREYFSA